MRSTKSITEPNNNNIINNSSNNIGNNGNSASSPTSPICRCRVTYLGSSVPHITKDGLQGIQEPLRELYPDKAALGSGNVGIDSWLSVWSNGILIENVDETGREVKRFFKIDALHYCAAVKFVPMPLNQQQLHSPYTTLPNGNLAAIPKFLPLDSPHARQANNNNPPIFASILRRTSGIKVLECHAFICKREAAANALVRCCFHAYADTMYAKQIGADINGSTSTNNSNNINANGINGNRERRTLDSQMVNHESASVRHEVGNPYSESGQPPIVSRRSKSIAALNDTADSRSEVWRPSNGSTNNKQGDNNIYARTDNGQVVRRKSINEHCDNNPAEQQQLINSQKFSKSMHHLNQSMNGWIPPQQQPFYNPYASRVPSYPPQNIIDATSNGGTIKSIRSLAANSIASTLMRSKKHAKAMSMAQLNHQDKITSFHQPHSNATTMIGPPIMMPPIPPMFLPNMPPHAIINGSQTMKIPSRPMIPVAGPHMNFEAMTPKEMKKLLKKGAKYGIDTSKFGENGLPLLPLRPPPQMPQSCHIPQHSKSGTIISQSKSVYSEIYSSDMPDMASIHGLPIHPKGSMCPEQYMGLESQMKPILVQPNPEFLKSKAGKKWLKQQKEFKKLLPPHLDGLPIVFGPPPMEALEPATVPNNNMQPMAFLPPPPPHPGIPMMDSSGFYNPNPFYSQNGRASAASTLLRYSPHSQLMHDQSNGMNGLNQNPSNYMQQGNTIIYNNGNNILSPSSMMQRMHGDYSGDDSSMIFGNQDAQNNRQYVDLGNRYQKRNHMVEQSVISLGDENDYDDDDGEEEDEVDVETDENSTGVQHNDYYSASNVGSESSSAHSRRPKQHQHQKQSSQSAGAKMNSRDRNHEHGFDHQTAVAAMQVADDQGSYSSGIYRRGHINERAFSYSIRQEHKSSGNSDAEQECHMNHRDNQQQQQQQQHQQQHPQHHSGNMFQGKRDQNDKYYHHDNNDSQSIPVNELTARLENQLNMKSFSNSRIKSHM